MVRPVMSGLSMSSPWLWGGEYVKDHDKLVGELKGDDEGGGEGADPSVIQDEEGK